MKGKVFVVVLLVCAAHIAHSEPTIWYVHPDSALNSIQRALNACFDNDIVLVGPGTYHENIIWPNTHGIYLTSELGPEVTIIDGDGAGSVVTYTTGVYATTHIHGFTIQNGRADSAGGGIACINSSPSITGNTIMNNNLVEGGQRRYGGGIACINSSPFIADNSIRNNSAGGWTNIAYGGGIACINSSPIIKDNSITDNRAEGINNASGGGISCDSGSSPMIAYNHIARNEDYAYISCGSAIACWDFSSPAIISNVITDNGWKCSYHGTVVLFNTSGTIIDNVIKHNHSHGIVCMWYSSPAIRGNTINGNQECGIECRELSSPYIDSCTISGNGAHGILCTVSSYGGGYPTVIHCNIHGNYGYGITNEDPSQTISAEDNWWGDATGPYHPDSNPGGLGDSVSDYVDFYPWLRDSVQWVGVEEQSIIKPVEKHVGLGATIFSGPLLLPEGKNCHVFDITGRVIKPNTMRPGIYFVEIDKQITQKVIKIR